MTTIKESDYILLTNLGKITVALNAVIDILQSDTEEYGITEAEYKIAYIALKAAQDRMFKTVKTEES